MRVSDLQSIFEEHTRIEKRDAIIILVFGVVFLALGPVLYFVKDNLPIWAVGLFVVIGAAMIFVALRIRGGDALNADQKKALEILTNSPEKLVWAYHTLSQKQGNFVLLCFKDKFEIKIGLNALPGKDANTFINELTSFNPQMVRGYSEQAEFKYNNNQL